MGTGAISAERMGVTSKDEHLGGPLTPAQGADCMVNDQYGSITGATSEHELLLQLAKTALKDAGSPNVGNRCGIVSGCLSFPRDGMQHKLQHDVYEGALERCASHSRPFVTLGSPMSCLPCSLCADQSGLSGSVLSSSAPWEARR